MNVKRILIDLKTDASGKASWIISDETGTIQQTAAWQDLTELTPVANHAEITVIVPGEEVLLTQVSLPKLSRSRLLQALPFALEDKLIEDVQHLHFAIGEYQVDTQVWPVAIVSKEKMDQWLNILKAANLSPSTLIPATLAIPFDPMHICHIEKNSIIRTGKFSGFVAEHENLETILQLHCTQPQCLSQSVNVYRFTDDPINIPNSLNVNDVSTNETSFLEKTHEWLQSQPTLNLLQGPYQSQKKQTVSKKIWMGIGGLTAACVGLLFISNIVSYFILQKASNQTEQAINTLYKQHFPQATHVVAPRERMESKLKKAAMQSGENQALRFIAVVGKSLTENPDIRLKNLDFRDKSLNLTVISASFNRLDDFTQAIKNDGLLVKQHSAGMVGSQVKATLLITDKGVS